MSKKKIATVWLAGCSGCHMSLLDIDERLLDVVALADIVKSPVDGKNLPDVDVTLVEGAVSSEEHVEELKHIRAKSKFVVAFGDCAVTANVASLRNLVGTEVALKKAYVELPSNVPGKLPPGDGSKGVSVLLPRVMPLHEVIKIDYYIPGCPPDADRIFDILLALLTDKTPDLSNERKASYG